MPRWLAFQARMRTSASCAAAVGVIGVPENVGNLNWGDDDWRTLYVAASSSIYRVRMNVSGNRLGYMR